MTKASIIIKRNNEATEAINKISANKSLYFIIHYSCESFYDNHDGHSPRITSIAVRNLDSGQTKSFSIHQFAEKKGITLQYYPTEYDKLELKMLTDFYKFVKEHTDVFWIHWNMRDINYGFEAIAHRCKVLGGKSFEIPDCKKIDLARLLIGLYGINYIKHPRLESLMKYNHISDRDFLSGAAEAKAFDEQEYVKLHQSTLRKVDILANIFNRIEDSSLKINSKLEFYKLYPQFWIEKSKQHWAVSLLGLFSLMFSLFKSVDLQATFVQIKKYIIILW